MNMHRASGRAHYRIRVKGHLDEVWQGWFGALVMSRAECGDTILEGDVVDQAALHGVLERIRDLNLELVSVEKVM